MRSVVYGAGAIGGVVGAGMAAAGEDVLLVDIMADHVAAMNESGLRIKSASGEQTVPVRAALPDDVEGTFDIVFLAVKCQHTSEALDKLLPLLRPDSVLVSLQNGINEPNIAARIGAERTIGCMVDVSADVFEPGYIVRGRRGNLFVGELDGRMTDRLEEVRRLLAYSVPTFSTDNVMGHVWSKVCKGTLDSTTALVDEDMGQVRGHKPTQPVLFGICREAVLVAQAEGVRLESFDHFDPSAFVDDSPSGRARAYEVLDAMAEGSKTDLKTRTGIWRDIVVRKRKIEVDYILGEIVRRGARHGIPTPINQRELELLQEIEAGMRPMSWDNLYELLHLMGETAPVGR